MIGLLDVPDDGIYILVGVDIRQTSDELKL